MKPTPATAPAAPKSLIPQHYFRVLCQFEPCRRPLGGFHFPGSGGVAIFACHSCRKVSLFRNEHFGITAHLIDAQGAELDSKTGKLKTESLP